MLKKDEKSHKNQLTETSIFDTMIKHLSRQPSAEMKGSIRKTWFLKKPKKVEKAG